MLKGIQSYYTFIGRLSKREKLILYGAVFFVLLTMADRLIVSPISSKLKSLDKEIMEKESSVQTNIELLARKDKIIAETKKYSRLLGGEQSKEELVTSLLKEIEGLANKSEVYIIDIKPAGSKDSGAVREYLISLNAEAQMEQLIEFMYSIENSSQLLSVDKYQISPKARESSVAKCSMSISKITMR